MSKTPAGAAALPVFGDIVVFPAKNRKKPPNRS